MPSTTPYRILDVGAYRLWDRRFPSRAAADSAVRRAYELDAFGEPVWGVIGPLLVVDTSDAVAPPEGWTSVPFDSVVQPRGGLFL